MKSGPLQLAILIACSLAAAAQMAVSHQPTAVPATSGTVLTANDRPVARINGTILTDRDLLRQMNSDFPYARQHGGQFPKMMEADIRRNALDKIEFEELVYQEALRRKLMVPSAKLTRAMEDFKAQFATENDFQNYLKVEHQGSLKDLKRKVTRAILIDELLTAQMAPAKKLTDVQVRTFYAKNPDRFRKPESVSIQTISFVIPDNATAKQKEDVSKRAHEALQQAKAAKNYEEFGLLAEKVSEDDWRVMMGDHKTVHRGRMPPPVEKVVFSMKAGEVSDIIETENSFCIARVNARDESKLVPFEQVRTKLKRDLEAMQAGKLRKDLEDRLRKNGKIEEL